MRSRLVLIPTLLLLFCFLFNPRAGFAQSESDLVPYSDDDGFLNLQLPADWEDVEFGPWVLDDEPVGLLLEASTDLDGFYGTWIVSGLMIGLSTDLVDETGGQSLLDRYDLSDSCTYEERDESVEELTINGETIEMRIYADFWAECDDSETIFAIIAGMPAEPMEQEYLFFVAGQMADPENDDEMFEAVLSSLDIDAEAFVAQFGAESNAALDDGDTEADEDEANEDEADEDEADEDEADEDEDTAKEKLPDSDAANDYITHVAEDVTADNVLSVQAPAEWSDVRTGAWVVGGESLGTLAELSTDLEAFYGSKDASGIVVAFTETPIEGLSQFILLDWYDDIFEECSFFDEVESEISIADAGKSITLPTIATLFTECDDTERSVGIIESATVGGYGLYIVAQSESAFEQNLLQRIAETIELNPVIELNPAIEQSREQEQEDDESSNQEGDKKEAESSEPTQRALPSGDSLTLQLRLQKGAVYRSRAIIDQEIEQSIPGNDITIEQAIGIEYRYDVRSIDEEGVATVEVTYDWISYAQSGSPTGDVSYDSSNPPAEIPPMALGYAGLLGQGFMMKMSPSGQVIEVSGLDKMLENMFATLDLPAGVEADAILESVKAQFGEEAMTSTLEQMTNIYPDDPVEIGESWARTFTIASGFPMIMDNTWTLTGRSNGVADLAVSTTVIPNPDAPGLDMGGIQLDYVLEGFQSGTISIDEASGWTLASALTQTFDGDLSAEGMTIPMAIVSTVTMTGTTEGHDASVDSVLSTGSNGENGDNDASDDSGDDSDDDSGDDAAGGAPDDAPDDSDDAADPVADRSAPRVGAEPSGDEESAKTDADADDSDNPADADDTNDAGETDDADDSGLPAAIIAAQELAATGQVDEALAAFEAALADDPITELTAVEATVAALVDAGEALYFEDKTWQALERYSTALELDPTSADAYVGRATVYRWFEEFDKALADLSTAIELGNDDYNYGEAFSERGYIHYQLDDYERAIADLSRAIEQDTSVAWYFELRGYAYRETGVYADALADFTAAIDMDEDDYEYKWAYINRASAYRELGDDEAAEADATAAIEIDPSYTWGYELRGRIYSDLNEHEKSIADMTTAIDFDQDEYDYSIVYGYRGYSYYQLDEYFKAVSDLTEAIDLFPKYTWAYETRGSVHSDNEQYDEAIADFTAALELEAENYDYSTVYTDRGIAFYELAEYDAAIDDLTEAIRLAPQYTWAYEWRGYANADVENHRAAIDDFSAAIELEQDDYVYQWAYSNRANSYYNVGEYALAITDLDKSIELDAEYLWAYNLRGELLGIQGRYDEAMADLRKSTELDPRSASAWNSLCWNGALYGYADEVVGEACESAVSFADEFDVPYYRDSRGVARALTGDADGALADFQAFIDDYGDNDLRLEWIERLEAGEDPATIFDDAMIGALIKESIPVVSEGADGDENEAENEAGDDETDADELLEEPLTPSAEPLSFSLGSSDLLEAAPSLGSLMAYSKDGSFRQQSPSDPLLMIVPSISERAIEDPSDFALERLELTANATIVEVTSHQPITIDGVDGFETVATGATTNSETVLTIYQVVLIQGDSYIVLKGLVGEALQDEYLPEFKRMARSLTIE